jgi:biopolymer transport protein ExbD/biopolymer transport protein TolR
MAINTGKGKQEGFSEINITPLTDIFLVLLIIMMVIAPLLDQQGLNLAIPDVGAPPENQQDFKIITVEVYQDGNMTVDGKKVGQKELVYTLQDLQKEKKDGLVIQADPDAIHKDVVFIMDTARAAGVENISIMQRTPEAQ